MVELTPSLSIALVLTLGIGAQWLAWRVNLPAILPLLLLGFLVGPVLGLITPLEHIKDAHLFPAVSLAVGLILFEGGLTLKRSEISQLRSVVLSLVSLGAIITWLGATVVGHYILALPWDLSFLFGALIIVTGPTVIGPLIHNVRPNAKIANVLKWEGILIDPIGALVAVLVFEYILIDNHTLGSTLGIFAQFIVVGTLIGLVAGFGLAALLKRRAIPDYLVNVISLAIVFAIFAISNAIVPESGLLATTIMGVVIANTNVPRMEELLSFKEDLTILFISILFIVLAANIELEAFLGALSWRSFLALALIMLVIRPLNIFVSSISSSLNLKEKLFLSWIAPRGIVAAAVTSLFASELAHEGVQGAEALVPLVFIIIVGTVAINSLSAKAVANRLGVAEPDPKGFLLLGAHQAARRIGKFLHDEGFTVVLADTNHSNTALARRQGLTSYLGSPLSARSDDDLPLSGVGRLLALTSNEEANGLASLKFAKNFGSKNVYQLKPASHSDEEGEFGDEQQGRIIFRGGTTYSQLNTLVNRGAEIKKTKITDKFSLEQFDAEHGTDYLPLFVMDDKGLEVVTARSFSVEAGDTLVTLMPNSPTSSTSATPRETTTQTPSPAAKDS